MATYSRREITTVEYAISLPATATAAEYDDVMAAVMAAAREELGGRGTAAVAEARDGGIVIRFDKPTPEGETR